MTGGLAALTPPSGRPPLAVRPALDSAPPRFRLTVPLPDGSWAEAETTRPLDDPERQRRRDLALAYWHHLHKEEGHPK